MTKGRPAHHAAKGGGHKNRMVSLHPPRGAQLLLWLHPVIALPALPHLALTNDLPSGLQAPASDTKTTALRHCPTSSYNCGRSNYIYIRVLYVHVVNVHIYLYMYVCICIYTHTYTSLYTYAYMCIGVFIQVSVSISISRWSYFSV